ncbi:hypothetical protein QUB60_28855 [Microcoleus sp. A2-C5]|nr:hypothetical protein [Lyngbya sp. CCAP 1446/10]
MTDLPFSALGYGSPRSFASLESSGINTALPFVEKVGGGSAF